MVTRAARAARVVSSAVTKRTAETLRRKANPEKQRSEQEEKERSREDSYDEGSTSSSSLSSLSSQSEFELSGEEGEEEEESLTVSRYFQRAAPPEIKKQKRAATMVKKEPAVKKEDTKREPAPSLGDIVPAIIKHEGKRKGKRVKGGNAPLKTETPPHWEEMYDAVREMRSRISAPVDTMGCERLADGASTPKIRRFQTLVSLMLSSQTKDTVNAIAMKRLQTELPNSLCLESILEVEPKRLDELIRVVGFHNRKTEYIKKAAIIIRDQFSGEIPSTFTGLTSLPGVGPKMAHLCMSAAWNNTQGIGVDVHVHRIANMWGWVNTTTPEGTREALEAWLPRERWREINHLLVGFGQSVCLPRGRKCGECSLAETGWCTAAWVGVPKKRRRVVVKEEWEGEGEVKEEVKMEEGGGIKEEIKTEPGGPARKRRKIKVEIKEEEEDDGGATIADIEDIIPNLKSPR